MSGCKHCLLSPHLCPHSPDNSLGNSEGSECAGLNGSPSPRAPTEDLLGPQPGDKPLGHEPGCPPRERTALALQNCMGSLLGGSDPVLLGWRSGMIRCKEFAYWSYQPPGHCRQSSHPLGSALHIHSGCSGGTSGNATGCPHKYDTWRGRGLRLYTIWDFHPYPSRVRSRNSRGSHFQGLDSAAVIEGEGGDSYNHILKHQGQGQGDMICKGTVVAEKVL